MPSRDDVERLREAQAGIRALVARDLEAFWSSLNLDRPEASRDALLQFVPALVAAYGESAAVLAADWYDDVRATERVPGRFRALMVVPDESEAAAATVRRAADALFTGAADDALVAIGAKAGKYALAGGRQTIIASTDRDPQAAGWQRVARAGACGFCRMLVGRGGVYRKATAHFASHGDCNCAAAPSWDPNAPEVDVRLYQASERMTGLRQRAAAGDKSAERQLAQHNALIQRAIGDYA